MNSLLRHGRIAGWLLVTSAVFLSGIQEPGPTGPRVGELGRPEALVVEGNRTFSREEILNGINWHIDFHLAAHPAAPLADYTGMLQKVILAGYRREGFPEATVLATVNTNTQRIAVQISEGPRFRCGEVQVTGLAAFTNAVIVQKLTAAVCGLNQAGEKDTNQFKAMWAKDEPAPFDDTARQTLTERVGGVLAEMNYYRPKINVRVVPDAIKKLASLQLEILDEGIRGVITQIEVAGLQKNSREQVLGYLDLKPGMELPALLVKNLTNQLWNSARFLKHEVTLAPLDEPGRFQLQLDLAEADEAPPLGQDFSAEEKAVLKLRDWLVQWDRRTEDLVGSISVTSPWGRVAGEIAVASSGLAIAARSGASPGSGPLLYGLVASSRGMNVDSGWRSRKLAFERTHGTMSVFLEFVPLPNPEKGLPFNLALGAGFDPKGELEPFRLLLRIAPVAMIHLVHSGDSDCSLQGGVLTLSRAGDETDSYAHVIRIDAATGRLMSAEFMNESGSLRLRAEERGYARVVKGIDDAAVSFVNDYAPEQALSSSLAFLASDLMRLPLATSFLTNQFPQFQDRWPLIQQAWTRATNLSLTAGFAHLFAPFEKRPSYYGAGGERFFHVPLDEVLGGPVSAGNFLALAGTFAVQQSGQVWRPGSWPWTLTREAGFLAAGRDRYSDTELNRLALSGDLGPLGCVLAAKLFGSLRPQRAGAFAVRGLSELTLDGFQKDCQVLLGEDSVMSQVLSNAVAMLGGISDDDVKLAAEWMTPDEGAFVRDGLQCIRAAGNQPFCEALRPVFQKHWDKVLKPRLLTILDCSLPPSQTPTTPEGLAKRGQIYADGQGVAPDYAQAADWYMKAAVQGHAGAQFSLAKLLESGAGVPQNFRESLKWYQKAEAQGFPHAACSLGVIYLEGRGVPVNLIEAARWFRQGTEQNCANAQFNLGLAILRQDDAQSAPTWNEAVKWFRQSAGRRDARGQYFLGLYYEKANQMAEALQWYRLAAAQGLLLAQTTLGDRLSDGFTTPPNYVEAYHWLSLAAAQGDPMAAVDLPRVERKLTPAQLERAKKQAAQVAAQHRARR